MLLFLILLPMILACSSSCSDCGSCSPQCPSLAAAFSDSSNLIVQTVFTSSNINSGSASYQGNISLCYQNTGSGRIFQALSQSTDSPCYASFLVGPGTTSEANEYIVSIPWHPTEVIKTPECFYVQLTASNYFKLVADLTAEEKQVLSQHKPSPPVDL